MTREETAPDTDVNFSGIAAAVAAAMLFHAFHLSMHEHFLFESKHHTHTQTEEMFDG